ncbi:gag-Pol polyprotein [Trichonephila clavipes]|nr:gag-Pol polyprotein [Trichonephila clavipes]
MSSLAFFAHANVFHHGGQPVPVELSIASIPEDGTEPKVICITVDHSNLLTTDKDRRANRYINELLSLKSHLPGSVPLEYLDFCVRGKFCQLAQGNRGLIVVKGSDQRKIFEKLGLFTINLEILPHFRDLNDHSLPDHLHDEVHEDFNISECTMVKSYRFARYLQYFNKLQAECKKQTAHLVEYFFDRLYKTQFSIVADANQWDSQTKACQLAASLRADAADILQTLPETQRLDFDALANALELRFGEKCVKDYSRLQLKSRQQKVSETLQELATDVERLSHLAFSDCPTEVREVLALQHFIDGVRDPEIQKALRMADLKDLKGALVFAMKFEAAQQATRKDRHPIRAVNESDTSNSNVERLERQMRSFLNRVESLMSQKADGKKTLKCWTCGREGHLQRSCREGHAKALKLISAFQKEVSEN